MGTFSAGPAPRPGAIPERTGVITTGAEPVYFKVSRRGGDMTFSWGKAANADAYEVRVRLSDGRRRTLLARRPEATVRDVDNEIGFEVSVRGVNEDSEFGPARSLSRASRKVVEPPQRRPKLKDPDAVGYAEVTAG